MAVTSARFFLLQKSGSILCSSVLGLDFFLHYWKISGFPYSLLEIILGIWIIKYLWTFKIISAFQYDFFLLLTYSVAIFLAIFYNLLFKKFFLHLLFRGCFTAVTKLWPLSLAFWGVWGGTRLRVHTDG